MTKNKLIIFFASIFFLTGCSNLSGDDDKNIVANGQTPKEIYQEAKNKLDSGNSEQAIDQFKLILKSYPGSKYAIQSRLDIAYNLYVLKKYNQSLNHLDFFIEKYPALPSTPYAYYLRGIVAEEKSASILGRFVTDSAQRDVQSVKDAYIYFNSLIEKFPDSEYSEDAILRLITLKNILSRHELYVAIYYTNRGSHIGAINRTKYIIENFPNSSSVPDALHLMAHNYDELNAEDLANDARKILTSSYPGYSQGYSIKK